MKLSKLLLTSLVIGSLTSYAQEDTPESLPKILAPSPEVASLMRFEEVPIDYYTGQPNISIPIFSKKLHQYVNLNVGLSYSSMGVRIDDRSGWVGTGWSLSAGGSIGRTVRGSADESTATDNLGVLHNPDFWVYNALSDSSKAEFMWNARGTSVDRYDTELDLYQFSFPGGSGRFVIVKDGQSLKPEILSAGQKFDIEIHEGNNFEIDSLTIIDANGIKYVFSEIETTTANIVTANESQVSGAPSTGNTYNQTSFRSAWHLSSIKTSNDMELATFTYQLSNENYLQSESITENEILAGVPPQGFHVGINGGILKPKKSFSYHNVSIGAKKLSTITFRDDTSLEFIKVTGESHPETSGVKLDSVYIRDHDGDVLKKFKFTTSTSNSRLWLDKIEEQSPDGLISLPHEFTYDGTLPVFGSPTDPWGYHNGSSVDVDMTDPTKVTDGLLTSIRFPTGGYKDFIWESHTYSYGVGGTLTNEHLLKNINNLDERSDQILLDDSFTLSSPEGIIHSQNLNVDFDQSVVISINNLVADPEDQGIMDNMRLTFYDASLNIVHNLPVYGETGMTVFLEEGTYTVKLRAPLIIGTYDIECDIQMSHYSEDSPLEEYLYGGGARIKQVNFREGSTIKRQFDYSYEDINDPNKSSGAVDAILGSITREYQMNSEKMIAMSTTSSTTLSDATIQYRIFEKGPNAQLTRGGYVGYGSVKVSETGNGYTLYQYETAKDHPNSANVFVFPFYPPENLDYKRGNLINKQVYNEEDELLTEVETVYKFDSLIISSSMKVVDYETCKWNQFYDTYSEYLNNTPSKNVPEINGAPAMATYDCGLSTGYSALSYDLTFTWAYPDTTFQRVYPEGGSNYNETTERFFYNSTNYQIYKIIKTLDEAGEEVDYTTNYYYPVYPPLGYPDDPESIADDLEDLNMVNTLIQIESTKTTGTIPNRVTTNISTVRNIFGSFNGNPDQMELSEVQISKGDEPLETRVVYHAYDEYGNVQEVSKEEDSHIVYLWGYGSTVPVAMVKNSTLTNVAGQITQSILDNPSGSEVFQTYLDDNLRTIIGAQVTTLSYHPGKGMLTIVDENGLEVHYEYDDLGRLLLIRDHDQNILEHFEYHYINE